MIPQKSGAPCVLLLTIACCWLSSCAMGLSAYRQRWDDSDRDLAAARSAPVYQARLALVSSPLFDHLPAATRHDRLLSTAVLGTELKDYKSAHRLVAQSSGMAEQGFEDWDRRLDLAVAIQDLDDATLALTHIAGSWPEKVPGYLPGAIMSIAFREVASEQQRAARFELRLALYRAHFTMEHQVAAGSLWGRLVRELYERGRVAEAFEILPDVNSPDELLKMRINKRFDKLVSQAPERFDVMAAAERQIRDYREATRRFPRSLDAIEQLCYAYESAGRYSAILRATEPVLSRVDDPEAFHKAYDEDETALNWILDLYAEAMKAAQQWDDAAGALELAAQGLEHGKPNISNIINLAGLYADLERGDKALRVLAEISDDHLSSYGRMQWHGARLAAALAKGDERLANESLAYLRKHQQDWISAYQIALLRSNHLEEAAKLLIARLHDPSDYQVALNEVQTYHEPPAPPVIMRLRERWRQVVSRPDVQRAIAAVGRVEVFDIPGPWD
jgi:hypothetical protein